MDKKHLRLSSGLLLVAAALPASAATQKTPEVRIDAELPNAGDAGPPLLAASGDSVYIAWSAKNPTANDIYFNRSLDGGATWLTTNKRLDTDLPGAAESYIGEIAASGESVYVTWTDRRNGWSDIYFNRSLDRGTTWLSSDIRVDTDPPGASSSSASCLAAVGEHVYVTWRDGRDGASDIYFNRSLDRGATWLSSDLGLDMDHPETPNSGIPSIAASGDSVFVIWTEASGYGLFSLGDIYLVRSLDAGASWSPAPVRLNTMFHGARGNGSLAVSGDFVYVAWSDQRFGVGDVHFNRSLDLGSTWLTADMRLDPNGPGGGHTRHPQLVASGDSVYVTYIDALTQTTLGLNFDCSLDRGSTWRAWPKRLSSKFVANAGTNQIAASGNSIFVVWTRPSQWGSYGSHIFLDRSLDGGATWLTEDVRMDSDDSWRSDSLSPRIAASGDSVYLTWRNRRNQSEHIYFTIPFGSQPYGEGTPGFQDITPRLQGTDSLNLGSTFTLTITDGLGGAFGMLGMGGPDSKAAIPFAGGTLLIDPIEHAFPIILDGPSGVPGVGRYSVEIPIPMDNAFLGFNVNLQAALIDPTTDAGVVLTNAVEAWIL